jgi:hypothetical protein
MGHPSSSGGESNESLSEGEAPEPCEWQDWNVEQDENDDQMVREQSVNRAVIPSPEGSANAHATFRMLTRGWEWTTQHTLCLFSGKTWDSPAETLEVCAREYGFDLRALRKEHRMDFYDGIRVINFVRKSVRARSDRAGPSHACRRVFAHLCLPLPAR